MIVNINFKIKSQESYEAFIRDILRRTSIIKTVQLYRCVQNAFDITYDEAVTAVAIAQKHGYVMKSTDGYVLNKGTYRYITEVNRKPDTAFYEVDFDDEHPVYEISMYKKFADQDVIDAMWLIADKMPESFDFVLTCGVFTAQFVCRNENNDKGLLYQIAKFPADREDSKIGLYGYVEGEKGMTKWFKENKDTVKRIAIIENEAHAFKFKDMGFSAITVIDENDKYGYRVVDPE